MDRQVDAEIDARKACWHSRLTEERQKISHVKQVFEMLGCGEALANDLTMLAIGCVAMNKVSLPKTNKCFFKSKY